MIRPASFSDVPALIEILREAKAASVYAEGINIDDREANRVLVNCVQRHMGQGENGTFVAVCETGGAVTGFIMGALSRVYHIMDKCTATDLFWIGTAKASARDKIGLMVEFIDWAKGHRKVHDIVCEASGAISDPVKLEKIMLKLGFSRYGGLWRIEVAK